MQVYFDMNYTTRGTVNSLNKMLSPSHSLMNAGVRVLISAWSLMPIPNKHLSSMMNLMIRIDTGNRSVICFIIPHNIMLM